MVNTTNAERKLGRGFTNVTKVPKITIIARITKITNQGSDTCKYNKSLKQSREKGFTYVAKIPKIITPKITKIKNQESDIGKYNKC